MKIQFAIVNPDIVAPSGGQSVVFGIARSKEPLEDLDIKTFAINTGSKPGGVYLFPTNDNMKNRSTDSGSDIDLLLTQPVWRKTVGEEIIGGDLAFLKAEPAGQGAGDDNHFIFFGVVSGDPLVMKSHSDQIFEAHFPEDLLMKTVDVPLINTGRSVTHKLGSHFSSMLRQTVWGFGDERVGLVDAKGVTEAKRHHTIIEEFVKHGKLPEDPEFNALRTDKVYQAYLLARDKIMPLRFQYWETEDERSARSSTPVRSLVKSLIDDGPSP